MSTPAPPIKVSEPAPPIRISPPEPPLRTLLPPFPVSVSAPAEPVRFSIPISVSFPTPVACDPEFPRFTVTAPPAEVYTAVSVPAPPSSVSLPAPPSSVSSPPPPLSVSLPAAPESVSLPPNPLITLFAALPVSALFREFPVPLSACVPERTRFSTLSGRVVENAALIVSVPPPLDSTMVSIKVDEAGELDVLEVLVLNSDARLE